MYTRRVETTSKLTNSRKERIIDWPMERRVPQPGAWISSKSNPSGLDESAQFDFIRGGRDGGNPTSVVGAEDDGDLGGVVGV